MGAFAPVGSLTPELLARVEREILRPTIDGMRAEGRPFRGVLFAGLMITPEGDPFLLEHNVRFGDPECEVLMALLDGDVAELFASVARGALDLTAVTVAQDRHAVAVVLAAAGYPASPRTGDVIDGDRPRLGGARGVGVPRRHGAPRRRRGDAGRACDDGHRDGRLACRGAGAGLSRGGRDPLRGHATPAGHRAHRLTTRDRWRSRFSS